VAPEYSDQASAAAEIAAVLQGLATQPALFAELNFAARAEALDELEVHVLDRLDSLPAPDFSAALSQLRAQALALQEQLEAVDQRLFAELRATIRAGHYTPSGLRALLTAYAGTGSWQPGGVATGYDSLDTLTNGLFPEPAQSLEALPREPEMVYYQKTPARIILELAAEITPQDIFYDLGSGLGQVPLLVHLLSGAPARGVEIEPAYCRHAETCATELQLSQVEFINADARAVDYSNGTAFFLFTPFTGHILQQVLDKLQQVAQRKPIRVFSYGPGTEALAQQSWLYRRGLAESRVYLLAEFHSC